MGKLCYKLKVTLGDSADVYCIMEIGEDQTFDDLSDLILKAFDFDDSHLYMFSLKRKRYDQEGIYHPMAKHKNCADRIRLRDVHPVQRNKYLYLYDFGDEWMFYITVMKISETDHKVSGRILEKQGEVEQYPNWDEEWDEDWDEDDEDWDEDAHEDVLQITYEHEDDTVLKEKLLTLPAVLQDIWLRLVRQEAIKAEVQEIKLIYRLEKTGLIEVTSEEMCERISLAMKVKRGISACEGYGLDDHLHQRCRQEQALQFLVQFYGVVEADELYELYCETMNDMASSDLREMIQMAMEKLSAWNFWNAMTASDGRKYISFYANDITEEILKQREKYHVKQYSTMSSEALETIRTEEWGEVNLVYGKIALYLMFDREWDPEFTGHFLNRLEILVASGRSEQEFFDWIQHELAAKGISFTKAMRKKFLDFRRKWPSAALKGYTWGEYEKERVDKGDGYCQLSLFEEELPFS